MPGSYRPKDISNNNVDIRSFNKLKLKKFNNLIKDLSIQKKESSEDLHYLLGKLLTIDQISIKDLVISRKLEESSEDSLDNSDNICS